MRFIANKHLAYSPHYVSKLASCERVLWYLLTCDAFVLLHGVQVLGKSRALTCITLPIGCPCYNTHLGGTPSEMVVRFVKHAYHFTAYYTCWPFARLNVCWLLALINFMELHSYNTHDSRFDCNERWGRFLTATARVRPRAVPSETNATSPRVNTT